MSLPVALDAHGTDSGPEVVLEGARLAAADGIAVRVFGPATLSSSDGVEVVPTEDWIANDADPVAAVRSTPSASVVRAAAEVADGVSGAVVSAGSTGATMTAALFAMKRLKGVHRPALAAQVPIPGEGGTMLFLDVGANTEVRPQHLIQFAFLGSAFSEAVLGVERPRVALLSVGELPYLGKVPEVVIAMAAAGAIHRPSTASWPSTWGCWSSGERARKKRASKRRGEISGVTQRTQGTSAETSSSRPASSCVSRTAQASREASAASSRPPGKTCAPAMKSTLRLRLTR